MSTPCVTVFEDAAGSPVAFIYRHWDGYPAEAGRDLLAFMELDAQASTGSRVGDPSYLAARYVAFLADKFREGGGVVDFLSVGVATEETDGEYVYYVAIDGSVTMDANPPGHGIIRREPLTLEMCV